MLKKPETYEEARAIMRNSADNEVARQQRSLYKKKIGLILAIAGGLSVAVMSTTGHTADVFMIVSLAVFALGAEVFPFLILLHYHKKIRDGRFFEEKTEEEVMQMAIDYVEGYNRLERQGKIKKT